MLLTSANIIINIEYTKKISSIVGWINNDKLLYVNKEKTLDYLSISAPIAEARDNQEFISAAKLLKDVEKSHLPGEKLYIRTKNFQNWFGKWEKNEQLSSKIAVKTAFYNLYRILVQLWLKAKKHPVGRTGRAFVCFRASY